MIFEGDHFFAPDSRSLTWVQHGMPRFTHQQRIVHYLRYWADEKATDPPSNLYRTAELPALHA